MIAARDLVKTYMRGSERLTVLNHISLDVGAGEFVALMGPSGSGKTTFLNIVAGLDRPDAGDITVAGADLRALNEGALAIWRSRNIGFVFQFYNLIPVLSALENVALPLSLFGLSRAERMDRARFALEIVGLADRTGHFPTQLSGGQEQRVAIARALVTDPSLIVADEPTGDLDRVSATEILGLLAQLNAEHGKTIVMVTHDAAAAEHAKRTVHFDKGRLAE